MKVLSIVASLKRVSDEWLVNQKREETKAGWEGPAWKGPYRPPEDDLSKVASRG